MKLEDFVGHGELSGVDTGHEQIKAYWGDGFEDCQTISFVIDNRAYMAIEDPDDGYRSSMKEIKEIPVGLIKNRFPPCDVVGVMRGNDGYNNSDRHYVVDFIDTRTGKIVLSVGTANEDDYYPMFEARFSPENMAINSVSKGAVSP